MTLAVNGEDFLDAVFIIFGMINLTLLAIRHMWEFTFFDWPINILWTLSKDLANAKPQATMMVLFDPGRNNSLAMIETPITGQAFPSSAHYIVMKGFVPECTFCKWGRRCRSGRGLKRNWMVWPCDILCNRPVNLVFCFDMLFILVTHAGNHRVLVVV